MSIREQLRAYLLERRIPQAVVARETEYSKASLSLYLGGKYPAEQGRIERALTGWLAKETASPRPLPKEKAGARPATTLRELFRRAIAERALTHVAVAKATGLSRPILSLYLGANYMADERPIERALSGWFHGSAAPAPTVRARRLGGRSLDLTIARPHIAEGRALAERRIALGLTQAELADRVAVQPHVLGQYEAGRAKPRAEIVLLLNAVLSDLELTAGAK